MAQLINQDVVRSRIKSQIKYWKKKFLIVGEDSKNVMGELARVRVTVKLNNDITQDGFDWSTKILDELNADLNFLISKQTSINMVIEALERDLELTYETEVNND
jgi:hypothetical protein